jgi:hypothetical protein
MTDKLVMASCNHIITLALSKLGVAGGHKKPRAEDLALGLTTLQSLYRALIDTGALGRARDVLVTEDYVARENDRILRLADATGDITLPETVAVTYGLPHLSCGEADYGLASALCGKRPPRNGAFVVINDAASGNTQEAVYDGYANKWMIVSDLNLDDRTEYRTHDGVLLETRTCAAPLSGNANGLAARLAVAMADHYQAALSPTTVRDAERFDAALVHGFGQSKPPLFTTHF